MSSNSSADVLLLHSGHHILTKTQTDWSMSKGQVARLEVVQEKRLHEDNRKELGALRTERRGLGGTRAPLREGLDLCSRRPTEDVKFSSQAGSRPLSTGLCHRVIIFLSLEDRCMNRGDWRPVVPKGSSCESRRVGKSTGHSAFRLGLGHGSAAWNPGPRGGELACPWAAWA